MARRKRRQRQPPALPPRYEERFYTPFDGLRESLQPIERPRLSPQTPVPPAVSNPPKAQAPPRVQNAPEVALFLDAMADVTPLTTDRRGRVEKRHLPPVGSALRPDPDVELADLRDLVEGRSAFTIQYTDEYMEGIAPGIDCRLAQRLHRGDYAIQAQLDLHGSTADEAKCLVDRFLTQAYLTGQRCVRLIHGRGRNSADNRPVLKENVQIWLSHGRLSRLVLAFATAPTHDGGAGATYVLLRRVTHPRRK